MRWVFDGLRAALGLCVWALLWSGVLVCSALMWCCGAYIDLVEQVRAEAGDGAK